jgi:hypothetical protein
MGQNGLWFFGGKVFILRVEKSKLLHAVKISNKNTMCIFKKDKGAEYTVYKALPKANPNPFVILCHDRDLDTESKALFCPGSYKVIFGQTKMSSNQKRQRLSVVKIKCGKRVIYRSFQARSIIGLNEDCIGLSPNACQELGIEPNGEKAVVRKGCIWGYFWNHPNSATRVSFRIGLPSLLVGLISLLLAILLK